jgi:hypothetical protein
MDIMSLARLILRLQLAAMAIGAAVLFYLFGFPDHTRHLVFASVITASYLVVTGIGTLVVQRSLRTRARAVGAASRPAP